MLDHQNEHHVDYDVVVSQGYTRLKSTAYTALADVEPMDVHRSDFDKGKIGRIVFTGFKRSLYPTAKFDSDTERRFALILEREAQKWFKPAKGQFQIHYQNGTDHAEYIPDFVAETASCIYLAETKAKDDIGTPEVQAKKAAAERWCAHATQHNQSIGKKPWKYLLVSHDQVQDNMGLEYFG